MFHICFKFLGRIIIEPSLFYYRTNHSIDISNKKSKKMAYYVTCNLPFVQGPPYVCVPPKKNAHYDFEICPPKRGNYKGVVVFQPGPWPIKYVLTSERKTNKFFKISLLFLGMLIRMAMKFHHLNQKIQQILNTHFGLLWIFMFKHLIHKKQLV